MDKIPSFQINHLLLRRGVYISRKDVFNGVTITTFDVRMKAPNREPVMDQGAMHTLEHLIATYLRNDPTWGKRIVYWGPMGCLTGAYLIVEGDRKPEDILPLLRDSWWTSMGRSPAPRRMIADATSYTIFPWQNLRQRSFLARYLPIPRPTASRTPSKRVEGAHPFCLPLAAHRSGNDSKGA